MSETRNENSKPHNYYTFGFKINERLYPNKLEHILLQKARELAEIDYNSSNNENAKLILQYIEPLLEADANNFYALFFRAYAEQVWTFENWFDTSLKSINTYNTVLDLAKERLGLTKDYYRFCSETMLIMGMRIQEGIMGSVLILCNIAAAVLNFADEISKIGNDNPQIVREKQDLLDKRKDELKRTFADASAKFEKVIDAIIMVYINWINPLPTEILADDTFNGEEWLKLAKRDANSTSGISSPISVTESLKEGGITPLSVNHKKERLLEDLCDQKLLDIHKWRVAKYWEAHPDEKSEIENSIVQMQKNIESLEVEKSESQKEIESEIAIEEKQFEVLKEKLRISKNKVLEEIRILDEEKSKQGFFAFGAKKDMKAKIEDKQKYIYDLEKDNSNKVKEVEERINGIKEKGQAISKELSNRIYGIKAQIAHNEDILKNKKE